MKLCQLLETNSPISISGFKNLKQGYWGGFMCYATAHHPDNHKEEVVVEFTRSSGDVDVISVRSMENGKVLPLTQISYDPTELPGSENSGEMS